MSGTVFLQKMKNYLATRVRLWVGAKECILAHGVLRRESIITSNTLSHWQQHHHPPMSVSLQLCKPKQVLYNRSTLLLVWWYIVCLFLLCLFVYMCHTYKLYTYRYKWYVCSSSQFLIIHDMYTSPSLSKPLNLKVKRDSC